MLPRYVMRFSLRPPSVCDDQFVNMKRWLICSAANSLRLTAEHTHSRHTFLYEYLWVLLNFDFKMHAALKKSITHIEMDDIWNCN